MMPYVELHGRSAFSFLEGSSLPETLIARCAELNQPAMALVDRDGVYGVPRFHMAAKKLGIKAHIGAEVTTDPSRMPLADGGTRASPRGGWFRLPLLVSSRTGYQNLCRLLTTMKLRAPKNEGAVFPQEVQEHAEGLICLTGGDDGPLAVSLKQGGLEQARSSIEHLLHIFGRHNVYVEIQRHFDRAQELRNRAAMEIARALDLPLLATNGVRYATQSERPLCDVFTAIRHHRTLATAGRLLARNSEGYVKSAEEMNRLFADIPEAIAHTEEVSSRLEFTLHDLGYEFPSYPVPEGETMMSFLGERAE